MLLQVSSILYPPFALLRSNQLPIQLSHRLSYSLIDSQQPGAGVWTSSYPLFVDSLCVPGGLLSALKIIGISEFLLCTLLLERLKKSGFLGILQTLPFGWTGGVLSNVQRNTCTVSKNESHSLLIWLGIIYAKAKSAKTSCEVAKGKGTRHFSFLVATIASPVILCFRDKYANTGYKFQRLRIVCPWFSRLLLRKKRQRGMFPSSCLLC